MSTSAIIGMVVTLSFIVGGFVFFLVLAVRKERESDHND